MGHKPREDAPDLIHHVTARVNWRAWHLSDDDAKATVARLIRDASEAYGVRIFGGVLMSNHIHLVIQSPPPALYRQLTSRRTECGHLRAWPKRHQKSTVIAQFMKAVRHPVSVSRQNDLGISGRFWEGEYSARPVLDPLSLVVRIAYDHRNPVTAAMVRRPEDYDWSSARAWVTRTVGRFPVSVDGPVPFGLTRAQLQAEIVRYHSLPVLDEVGAELRRIFLDRSAEAAMAALRRVLRSR